MNTGRVLAATITVATVIFIAIGTLHPDKSALEYAGGKNLLRTSSTPQAAVENLGDEIRLRAWGAAYATLDNKAEFTQADFMHDLTGYYLSLRTYATSGDLRGAAAACLQPTRQRFDFACIGLP